MNVKWLKRLCFCKNCMCSEQTGKLAFNTTMHGAKNEVIACAKGMMDQGPKKFLK